MKNSSKLKAACLKTSAFKNLEEVRHVFRWKAAPAISDESHLDLTLHCRFVHKVVVTKLLKSEDSKTINTMVYPTLGRFSVCVPKILGTKTIASSSLYSFHVLWDFPGTLGEFSWKDCLDEKAAIGTWSKLNNITCSCIDCTDFLFLERTWRVWERRMGVCSHFHGQISPQRKEDRFCQASTMAPKNGCKGRKRR